MSPLEEKTLPRMLAAACEQHGERVAIEEGTQQLEYRELALACRRAAAGFIAAGVSTGDRVAIWAPNIKEWILAALGLQSVGGVLVPINTRFKGAEAAYVINRSGARLLCTVGDFLGVDYPAMLQAQDTPSLERTVLLKAAPETLQDATVGWAEFLEAGTAVTDEVIDQRIEAVEPSDLSDILFTSGTTGHPKGVMTTHAQNLRTFRTWTELVGLTAGDRYLIVNPFFHAFGYKAGWLSCIMRGATILPHLVFDPDAVLRRVGDERISVLPGPPALYQSLLAHPERGDYDLSCLRLAVTGAAAIPVSLIERMKRDLGFDTVITGYGLTESTGVVSMCRFDDDPQTIATTSGRAIDGVEVRCVDDEGKELERGQPGEVVVRGYNVMVGYLDDEAATAEAIDGDGWLHTGDIAVMDERGYLRITDRKKDMFITGGFNCYPAEIENLMAANEDYVQVAIIGIPDERLGEVAMVFIVPAAGAQLTEQGVIAWCRDAMANYKVPRRVSLVDALPMNAAGKVQKFLLREGVG